MFTRETIDKNSQLEKEWKKKIPEEGGEKQSTYVNQSDIEIKSTYGPKDLQEIDYSEIGLPGEYPFTRSNYPVHYQAMPLMMTHGFGCGDPVETRKRREVLKKLGSHLRVGVEEDAVVYVLLLDLPTQRGYDPDEREAVGKVGECGVSASNLRDYELLYDGLQLDKVFTVLIAFNSILPQTALYAAYCTDIRKEPLEKLFFYGCNQHFHSWYWDVPAFPPKIAMRLNIEFLKWNIDNCPLSFPCQVEGYNPAEAGANPVQELAFNLANTIASLEEGIKVGLDPDDMAPKFASHPHIGMNLFEEVAKIRALRRLWAKIMKERFGCKKRESLTLNMFVSQTAGVELVAQEPLNNIIRTTIMAMAGMFAQVEGCWISSYDEALGIPTEEAVKTCVRTYQILNEETDIPRVTDPLGGSYYIEWLTSKMEKEVIELLNKMDRMGGYIKLWESGWMRSEIERNANEKLRKLETGEEVKVGRNKYVTGKAPKYVPYRRPIESEERAVERVKKYRQERDQGKTDDALAKVREAAIKIDKEWPESCGIFMPALVEAARARATGGEMQRIMREVFGTAYYI